MSREDDERLESLLRRKRAIIKARNSLIDYVKYTAPDPANREDVRESAYQDAKHHRVIAAGLEEVEAGRMTRLIILCPPRHGKTRLATHAFPAWYSGRNPSRSLISATYNDTFSVDFGKAVRGLIKSPYHQHVFPSHRLKPGSASSSRLSTLEHGDLFFSGVGGSLTGRGADVILIDDPIKNRKDADSLIIRDAMWQWYTEVLRTRLMTEKGAIVIIQTRWHADDLVGRLLDPTNPYYSEAEAAKWRVIDLPALAGEEDVLGRKVGQPLWPERFGRDYLEQIRKSDPRGFTALYQNRPTPPEGAFFKADSIRTYASMRDVPATESLRFYGSSDLAVSTSQTSDKSCLMVIGIDKDDDIWIMPDLVWGRFSSDVVVERMINLMAKYRPQMWWGERGQITKSIGPFLRKRMLEKRVFCTMDEITPIADKMSRAQSIHARMSMRKVHFPIFAPWFADARDQLLKFPQGVKDDFCDTLALVGLGLSKQIPHRMLKKAQDGPREYTLGWIKQLTRDKARAEARDSNGF